MCSALWGSLSLLSVSGAWQHPSTYPWFWDQSRWSPCENNSWKCDKHLWDGCWAISCCTELYHRSPDVNKQRKLHLRLSQFIQVLWHKHLCDSQRPCQSTWQPFNAHFDKQASANPFSLCDRRHWSHALLSLSGKHCIKCVISSEKNRYWHVNTFPFWNVGMRIFYLWTNKSRHVSEKDVAEFATDILCNLHRDSDLRWGGTQPTSCFPSPAENCQWIFTDARRTCRKLRWNMSYFSRQWLIAVFVSFFPCWRLTQVNFITNSCSDTLLLHSRGSMSRALLLQRDEGRALLFTAVYISHDGGGRWASLASCQIRPRRAAEVVCFSQVWGFSRESRGCME